MDIKYDIYEPAEDSFLILKQVSKYSKGTVLEIGTGSGILAAEASLKAKVTAVDLNEDALMYCKKKYKGIKFLYSDLFSKVNGKFDLIIFNPPYLPLDEREPLHSRLATTGGKKGYEILERFFLEVSYYLKEKGKILVLFSTLTGKDKVHSILEETGFSFLKLSEKNLFQETLFIYLAEKSSLLQSLEKEGVKEIHLFAKGKRGIIFKGKLGKSIVAVKSKNVRSKAEGRIQNEAKWLKKLNKKGIGPKLLKVKKNYFMYEFVEGIFIPSFIEKSSKLKIKKVFSKVFDQCFVLDKLGVNKEEMHNPFKHLIINKDKVVFIDFERAHLSSKPKNVTQFCQYLISKKIELVLNKKGFKFSKKKLINLAKEYKRDMCKKNFKKIISLIR